MRIRLLHPEFYSDEDLAACSDFARLIFGGLWLLADREGRLPDNVRWIDGELLRHDKRSSTKALKELADNGFIVRYTCDAGAVIQIPTFGKWQRPHLREKASQLPAPPKAVPKKRRRQALDAPPPGLDPPVIDLDLVSDPVIDPDQDQDPDPVSTSSAASASPPAARPDGPDANLGVITKIAHEVLDLRIANGEREEAIKGLCAQRHIAYNSAVVGKALDSAVAQRGAKSHV